MGLNHKPEEGHILNRFDQSAAVEVSKAYLEVNGLKELILRHMGVLGLGRVAIP